MAKKHNWVTKEKYVDKMVDAGQMLRVCSCNHLTPAAEAEMDNLIEGDDESVARFINAVVTNNLPMADEVPETWDADTEKGPSRQALNEIEKEEQEEIRAMC